jgi:hypothetical protein
MKALSDSGTHQKPSAKFSSPPEERPFDEMEIDFGLCPAFTEEMFYATLQMLRDTNAARKTHLKIDTTNATSIDRQIKVSGFDPEHISEQAHLLMQAIKGGIALSQAKPHKPEEIEADPRHTLNNSRFFLDYNFITMGL